MAKKYVIDGKVGRNIFIEDKYVEQEFYKLENLPYRWVDGGVGLAIISWLPSDE